MQHIFVVKKKKVHNLVIGIEYRIYLRAAVMMQVLSEQTQLLLS